MIAQCFLKMSSITQKHPLCDTWAVNVQVMRALQMIENWRSPDFCKVRSRGAYGIYSFMYQSRKIREIDFNEWCRSSASYKSISSETDITDREYQASDSSNALSISDRDQFHRSHGLSSTRMATSSFVTWAAKSTAMPPISPTPFQPSLGLSASLSSY